MFHVPYNLLLHSEKKPYFGNVFIEDDEAVDAIVNRINSVQKQVFIT